MKKNYLFLSVLFCLLPLFLVAQAPEAYYDSAVGKNKASLKTALHQTIKGHKKRTYGNLWTDMRTTDMRADGKVWDMYSNCDFIWGTLSQGGQQDSGLVTNQECLYYNREHSFPNSWFGGGDSDTIYTDLFHLYPTDKYVNRERGNYPFGEVQYPTTTYGNGSKLGNCTFPGYNNTVFEPIDEYKGDFARTYFYVVTRYENRMADWYSTASHTLDGSTYPSLSEWTKNLMLKWHRQDPVSPKETARNNAVYAIQKNRNPYIDHPALVEYIWGDSMSRAWGANTIPDPDPDPEPDPDTIFSLFENFETVISGSSNNYNGNLVTFASGQWFVKGLVTGTLPNPDTADREIGSSSIRLRGNETEKDHRIEMRFDKSNGVGTVSYKYASYRSHNGGIPQLQISTDAGETWVNYGNEVVAPSWSGSFLTNVVTVNQAGNVRIRIVNLVSTKYNAVNIDDIGITDYIDSTSVVVVDAQAPTFTAHPQSASYYSGDTAVPLFVTAAVSDGGTLSYQWYSNTSNNTSGSSPIMGATAANFTPSTLSVGATYYYAVVGNTNNSVNGEKTAIANSNIAVVIVNESGTTMTKLEKTNNVRVYPNPLGKGEILYLELPADQVCEVSLYDTLGKTVFKKTLYGQQTLVMPEQSGLYFLHIGERVMKILVR